MFRNAPRVSLFGADKVTYRLAGTGRSGSGITLSGQGTVRMRRHLPEPNHTMILRWSCHDEALC
jgi:hypothetical protein